MGRRGEGDDQATGPRIKSFTALTIFHNFPIFRKTCSRLVGSRRASEFVCTRASYSFGRVYCDQTRMSAVLTRE